jgi:hypothetical protein
MQRFWTWSTTESTLTKKICATKRVLARPASLNVKDLSIKKATRKTRRK